MLVSRIHRRSTSGSMQFLGDRLVSWSSKTQKSDAISSTAKLNILHFLFIEAYNNNFTLIKEHVQEWCDRTYLVNTVINWRTSLLKHWQRIIEFLINKLGMRSLRETSAQLTDEVMNSVATAKVHHHLDTFFKITIEHIANLEYFRQMLQICPKLHDQQFEELPFKEEILTFLRDLGHIKVEEIKKNLYKALVDAYKSDKLILDTYGDTFSFKRRRDDEDKDEEPSAGSNRGSKRRRARKEPESVSAPKEKTSKIIGKSTKGSKSHHESVDKSVQAEEPIYTTEDLEEPAHQEFVTGDTKDKPDEETSQLPHCTLAQKEDTRESFNELMDTPLDFSAFVMNMLKVDTLTPELLVGPTFKLMKGSCKSLVELEYFFEEVYKETTNQLDWNNPKGQQYPHDMRKPLPLIPNSRGRQVIPFDHFINNDLAYLSGGVSSRAYTTSVMKTKAADYRHIK
ncbi:hypothetical protein Tco_0654139 [Tanacetum coccineum]|uniref:Uncharacterized protein n=1 Tax=Tanacetum coccineum TaxID=301880 RepID=A0ABQ4X2J8_9ASTR